MNEEMNRTEDANLEENFDELFAEKAKDQEENHPEISSVESEEKAEKEPAAETEPKYKVKFLGEEKELSVSELVTAAQKGMNYDHVKAERDRLKSTAEQREDIYKLVEQMAKESGMTVEEYARLCGQTLKDNQVRAQVERGVPEDIAKRLLELEEKENLRSAEEEKRRAELEKQEAYSELVRAYPDVKALPDEVVQAVAAGERPLNAYRDYENRRLKNELAVLKKAQENKLKTTGSLQGDAPEEANDFLSGFNSV